MRGVPDTVEVSSTGIRLKNHYRVLRFGDYDCFDRFEADNDLRTMGVVPEPARAAGGSPFAPI